MKHVLLASDGIVIGFHGLEDLADIVCQILGVAPGVGDCKQLFATLGLFPCFFFQFGKKQFAFGLGPQLIGVKDAFARKEFVPDDELILQIGEQPVELVIELHHILFPDVVTNRIILAEEVALFEQVGILIGE